MSYLRPQLNRDKAAFDVAKQCCDLFVLSRLEQMALPLLEWGYFTPAQMQLLRAEVACTFTRLTVSAHLRNFLGP